MCSLGDEARVGLNFFGRISDRVISLNHENSRNVLRIFKEGIEYNPTDF